MSGSSSGAPSVTVRPPSPRDDGLPLLDVPEPEEPAAEGDPLELPALGPPLAPLPPVAPPLEPDPPPSSSPLELSGLKGLPEPCELELQPNMKNIAAKEPSHTHLMIVIVPSLLSSFHYPVMRRGFTRCGGAARNSRTEIDGPFYGAPPPAARGPIWQ